MCILTFTSCTLFPESKLDEELQCAGYWGVLRLRRTYHIEHPALRDKMDLTSPP